MSFNIGDRVEYINQSPVNNGRIRYGSIGTVVSMSSDFELAVGVEWDEEIGSHNLRGKCKWGHGWWTSEGSLTLHTEEQLELASDAELMQLLFGK